MAEQKRCDVTFTFSDPVEAEMFRTFVANLEYDEEGNRNAEPSGVELVYEEEFSGGVAIDLMFATPRTAYYFAVRWLPHYVEWQRWKGGTANG